MSKIQKAIDSLQGAVALSQTITVKDAEKLRENIDALAFASALGTADDQAVARWLVWEIAQALGIYPASIHELYTARGRGELPNDFTVPAMNLRVMTYDCARAVFRAAIARNAGAFIFEIARSEMTYSFQRPQEYVTSILAAAIKEGWNGPVFIQGDHFQVSHARYKVDPEKEVQTVKDLATEAIAAGFYNIDVDTSTLVDIAKADLRAQQHLNGKHCAEISAFIRSIEPKGVTVSIGGEIGEVGLTNSTEPELRAFMDEFNANFVAGLPGLSKISIQTGTSHGGTVLPDGSIAEAKVDFDTIRHLGEVAREYEAGGAVQHGASTLPDTAFTKFPQVGTLEIHLATNFMTMMFDRVPESLRQEMNEWIKANYPKPENQSEEQFLYKNRKNVTGPFKSHVWNLPADQKQVITSAWEAQFGMLFDSLNIANTIDYVDRVIHAYPVRKTLADFGVTEKEAEDVSDLSD